LPWVKIKPRGGLFRFVALLIDRNDSVMFVVNKIRGYQMYFWLSLKHFQQSLKVAKNCLQLFHSTLLELA
jgi:hypothetical protein